MDPDSNQTIELFGDSVFDLQGNAFEAFSASYVMDTKAPRIVSISVRKDQVLPAGDLQVDVRFDEPMEISELTKSNIHLSNGETRRFEFEILPSNSDRELSVRFANLSPGEYRLRINARSAIEDIVGNRLDGEFNGNGQPSGDGDAGGRYETEFELALAGDSNLDGLIDFSDFLALSSNFGKDVDSAWADGDFDGDARVTFADFLILSDNFGSKVT